jgi:hypothetical protein
MSADVMSRSVRSAEELYGTWRLMSWTRRLLDTGETVEAFGKAPRGYLNYSRDGRVFFIMTKQNRAKPADLTKLTDAERAELYNTMVAYAGTFTFDGNLATCHVDISWNEAWTDTDQPRAVRFEGGRLIWSTNPQTGIDGKRVESVFVWEKLP